MQISRKIKKTHRHNLSQWYSDKIQLTNKRREKVHSVVWEARFRHFPAEIKVADWSAFASLSSRYSRLDVNMIIRKLQEMEVTESCTAAPYIQYIKKKKTL